MSAPHRCAQCRHRPGPRSTAPVAKAEAKGPRPHGPQAKKAPCGCACHRREA